MLSRFYGIRHDVVTVFVPSVDGVELLKDFFMACKQIDDILLTRSKYIPAYIQR